MLGLEQVSGRLGSHLLTAQSALLEAATAVPNAAPFRMADWGTCQVEVSIGPR